MKVTVAVQGRFHAFDLARELHRQGALARLITSYPAFVARRFGVPGELVHSAVGTEMLARAWRKLPADVGRAWDPQPRLNRRFERVAMQQLDPASDVFVGWSGSSLAALRRARSLGLTTVVERGSSHILDQCALLAEEYERAGLRPVMAHPRVVEAELAEYEEADAIAVPSHFVRRTFLARGVPASRLIHVPYGVSLAGFRPALAEHDGVFRILHCGTVSLRKGCHLLLQAFAECRLPGAELWFVGRVLPEMAPFLRRWGGPRVVLHGVQPQASLPRIYARASVFCLASIEEGLAMVLLQAMACGLPVIASVHTGAEDVLRDGRDGFLVPVRDVEALKQKILLLHEDAALRAAMAASSRERVASGFSWEDYGRRILSAYAELRARRCVPAGSAP